MFLIWIVVVDDGKGGGIVVNTTDICTLNLIATLICNGDVYTDTRRRVHSRDLYWQKWSFPQVPAFSENCAA